MYKCIFIFIFFIIITGCNKKQANNYEIYNASTNTNMSEEEYTLYLIDNDIKSLSEELANNQNNSMADSESVHNAIPRGSETISMYSSQPYRNYVNYHPYPEIPAIPLVDHNALMAAMVERLKTPPQPFTPVETSRNSGTVNSPKHQNPPVTRQQPLKGQQEKEHSATKSSPAQPAQLPQQTSTTVAQGNAWEQIYRNAVQGNPQAQYQIGVGLVTGRGVAKNYNAGVEWLRKSAMQGYEPAREVLTKLYQGIMR